MTTYSNILAWEMPWTKELGMLQSMRSQESDRTQQLNKKIAYITRQGTPGPTGDFRVECYISSLRVQNILLTSTIQTTNILRNVYIFPAALGLHCCMWAFSSCGEQGSSLVAVCGFSLQWLLIAVASLVVEHGLWSAGSAVVARGLTCLKACGIFPNQGLNQDSLCWQVDA